MSACILVEWFSWNRSEETRRVRYRLGVITGRSSSSSRDYSPSQLSAPGRHMVPSQWLGILVHVQWKPPVKSGQPMVLQVIPFDGQRALPHLTQRSLQLPQIILRVLHSCDATPFSADCWKKATVGFGEKYSDYQSLPFFGQHLFEIISSSV